MSDTITVDLTPETSSILDDAIRSGDYPNASAVVITALAALHRIHGETRGDELLGYSMDELRRLGDEGLASGPSTLSTEEIAREGFRRAGVPHPAS